MGLRNLKESLGKERESSRGLGRKRTGDLIQWEYYIAIDKAIHEKIWLRLLWQWETPEKNQLRLISAGIQMQSFIHMQKKTGN